ncbi:hypothetical protein ACFY3M_41905 [Streptomyces mirabilis]|uniref:hypothetical protein n=1 Tax=Streptomyces mirabilis TaxID=68239 RepID=UPI0036ABEAFE
MGHTLGDGIWRRAVDHYLHRVSHGSTLSGRVHGWVLARARRTEARTYWQEALRGDIADLQGGTTRHARRADGRHARRFCSDHLGRAVCPMFPTATGDAHRDGASRVGHRFRGTGVHPPPLAIVHVV